MDGSQWPVGSDEWVREQVGEFATVCRMCGSIFETDADGLCHRVGFINGSVHIYSSDTEFLENKDSVFCFQGLDAGSWFCLVIS